MSHLLSRIAIPGRPKARLAALTLAAIASLGASTAFAMSPTAMQTPKPDNLVQKVHGCHRSCEFGYIPRWGVSRWHRYGGPGCYPVRCVPRAAHPNRCWVDGWGVRHCRW